MEAELKEYLRRCHSMSSDDIARIEKTATEDQLDVLRKGMQSWMELTGGKTLEQMTQEFQQEQQAAREKAMREARQKAREERVRKRNQIAMGLAVVPAVMILCMIISALKPAESHTPRTKAEMEAVALAEQWAESAYVAKSYQSTIDRLIGLGYSKTEAKVAADYCGADWNEQALKYAKIQLNSDPNLSGGDLRAFLSLEGFTSEEIQYALEHCR